MNRGAYLVFVLSFLLCTSESDGQTGWFPLSSGTTNNLNSVFFTGVDTGYVVGDAGTILRTVDAGVTWTTASSGVTDDLNDLYFFTPDTGVVVGDNGTILRSIDAGLTWATVASGVTDNLNAVAFDCDQPNGFAGGSSQTIIRSTNRGRTWSLVQTGFFGEFNGGNMSNPTNGIIVGENSIFQPLAGFTTDGGATWEYHAFYLNNNEGQAEDVYQFGPGTSVVVSSVWDGTGAISRTTNGGDDWTTMIVVEDLSGVDFPTTSTGYAVGSSGTIMKSTDSGVTWTSQVSNSTEKLNEVSFANDSVGYSVGDNGTILKTTTGGIIVSVEPTTYAAPLEFRLYHNYPNPFNPTTLIKFELATEADATITLYNTLGQNVATIFDGHRTAGTYVVEFDGRDLPSGSYFYQLRTGGFLQTKRMMLVK
jgi:photosystem II stability/assembly factor-like uncharacterized protein